MTGADDDVDAGDTWASWPAKLDEPSDPWASPDADPASVPDWSPTVDPGW